MFENIKIYLQKKIVMIVFNCKSGSFKKIEGKMELLRFREIRERVREIVDIIDALNNKTIQLTEEQADQIEAECSKLLDEIHNSNLSNIPFEEFRGFYDIGFDFSATGANIDFDLIDISHNEFNLRYQGCTVRNVDLSKVENARLDDQSFDSDVIEANPEYFAPQKITDPVARDRYYRGWLNLSDLQTYDLKDIDPSRVERGLRTLIDAIGMDKAFDLDGEIVNLVEYKFTLNVSSNKLTPDSSIEEIEDVLRDTVVHELTNSRYSGRNSEERLLQSAYVLENLPEYVIDLPEGQEELREKFFERELTLGDISENLELFKGKKFIDRFKSYDSYRITSDYPDLTEDQMIYLMEQLPNIAELVKGDISDFAYAASAIDIEKETEENKTAVVEKFRSYKDEHPHDYYSSRSQAASLVIREMSSYEELINDPRLDFFEIQKYHMLKVIASPSLERLEALEGVDIKDLIQAGNSSFFSFFDIYGIDTVLDFEEANGPFFTKDGGRMISFINNAYMYYAGNDHNINTSLYGMKSWDDPNPEYTKEQFEEYVRRMIVYGPTDSNYTYKNKLDYRELRGPFRDEHLDLFLPEDAPAELQDKFYKSVITIEDISSHPEYVQYLKDVDIGISLEYLPFSVNGQYREGWNFIKEKSASIEEALSFITENASVIKYLKKGSYYSTPDVSQDMSLDDAVLIFNKEVEDRIINHNLSYGEDAPEYFKANHEDYFLAEEAPDILKDAFYPDRRKIAGYQPVIFDEASVEELSKQEGWQQYLLGKNKGITKEVLTKFVEMSDSQAGKETFLYYLENEQETAIDLIGAMTTEQIIQIEVILPEEQLEKLIEEQPNNALKILLFSENVYKDKLLLLSKYKEINNQTNTLDSALLNVYLENHTDVDELNKKIDEIYNLFTYDNVPEFLKTYKLFELGKFASAENDRIQSYAGADQKTKRNIMMADLFRISLDSDNKSLRDFANIMKYGDEILGKVTGNGEFDLSGLSEEEHAIFSQYVDTLVTMHNISVNNGENKTTIELRHDAKTDFERLTKQYENGEVTFSSSKVLTEMFNGEVALEVTPDSILQYMDMKKEQRSAQTKANSEAIKSGYLKLESGDFIKGVGSFESYLKSMTRNGLKGGEFNREFSHSDATELDLDFGYVSDANFEPWQETDYDVIATTISHGYGNTYIVLKDYGKKFEPEGQTQDDMPIKFSRGPEYWTNHLDDNTEVKTKDRYVRTGVGVLDIDYMVSKEWKPSFGYEMAMAGVFIPVKNEKDELVFSHEDYEAIRAQMKGLSYYETEPFEVDAKAKKMEGLYDLYRSLGGDEAKIEECEEVLAGKEDSVTAAKKKATLEYLKGFFEPRKIRVVDNLSSDLSADEVELIDTGSTGRGTNVPGDGDFDFMLRHNLPQEVLSELQTYVFALQRDDGMIVEDGFRTKGAVLPNGKKVDIDITYAKKDLGLEYSSDMSVKDRLNSIKEASPEDYNYVRANIIMAKNILKKMEIYKKRGSDGAKENGGFGGIGVENWILQNGGSFEQAISTYLATAKDENGKDLSYQEFIEKYPIFDFGNNHREGRSLHDRFSAFLGGISDSDGHEKAFTSVKKTFAEIQRNLREHQETKVADSVTVEEPEERKAEPTEVQEEQVVANFDEASTAEQKPSALRKSISVEGLREVSKSKFAEFTKDNFVLMAKLVAKYSKTRVEDQKVAGEQSKDEGASL